MPPMIEYRPAVLGPKFLCKLKVLKTYSMVLGEMELIAAERGEYMNTAGDVTLAT